MTPVATSSRSTLTATNGTVTLAGTTGLTITGGANGSATVTVQGTLTDLNRALDGLSFNPTASYFGGASLQVTTNDLGQTGSGVPESDIDTINITVNEVNYAPVITSNGGGATAGISVPENTFAVTTVAATDANPGNTLSYSIGGTDAALFDIDSVTGALTFKALPDFEVPVDANTDNDYELTVTVSDGNTGSDAQDITVTVTQVADSGAALWSNTTATPQSSDWDGSSFGTTSGTDTLNNRLRVMQGADAPTRDEKIIVGIDSNNPGQVTGELWDGTSWTALPLSMGTVSENYWYGAEVAYEQLSGDAVVVWNDNSQAVGDKLRFAVWDGSTWSAPQSIGSYAGTEPQNLRLAFDPGSDTLALVVSDVAADDHVMIWDGSAWGNAVTLDSSGTAESDQSAIAVAFQAQTGDAMVAYGINGSSAVYYRIWDGASWSAQASVPAAGGVTGDAAWLSTASDYNSDRIALATMTGAGEVWLNVWDGTAWESSVLAETGSTGTVYPNLSVAFESSTGDALATYGEGTSSIVKYRTWDAVGGWSAELSGPNLGAVPNSMTLDAGPNGDGIMLSVQDANNDLHYVLWNGSSWEADNVLSTNTGEVKNQPFVFIYDQDGTLVEPNAAPVNTVPATQNTLVDTAVVFSTANGNLISVADTDDASVEVTLNATNGTLTLSGTTGLAFTLGGGSDDTDMTFSGTQADVNAALDGLQFDPTAAFEGFASIQISTTDFGGVGAGSPATDVDGVTIEVGDVNTVPVNTVPAAQTIDQDGMLLFSSGTDTAITISDPDAGGAAVEVMLTATDGTLNLSGFKGLTFSVGDGTADATMTFTGSIANINAALEGATFVANPGFTGAASVQIVTDDQGNTGSGGALSDTDSVNITVQARDTALWLTTATDETNSGAPGLNSWTGGQILQFGGSLNLEPGTTSGTFSAVFNLDDPAFGDTDTIVNALHHVGRDITVGTNSIQLYAGDIVLSTQGTENLTGLSISEKSVFVFHPDTPGDYSSGTFTRLIDGTDLGFGRVVGVTLVEQTTVVGGTTLNAGEFLLAHEGSNKNIIRFTPGTLGDTTTGTASILIAGNDIDIGQNIHAIELIEETAQLGDVTLQPGQILLALKADDSAVGDAPMIAVSKFDIFVLDVTATGDGTSAATATLLFEGADVNLDNGGKEDIWGISLYVSNQAPDANDASFSLNENSANGTLVGSVIGTDAEREAQISALLAADPDLVYNAETGKFYQVDSGWYEPAEARTNAESNLLNGVNGQLVTIRNAAENEFVWDLVKSLGARTWIGATDATVEGEWRWIESGSEADQFWSGLEDGYAVNGAYQNWASGSQPNQSGEEDWAQMDNATGEWWDNKADTVHHFVTEWYADDVLDVTDPLNYAITAGNTDGAFAIDASTGQITVANSAALDFETTPSFTLTVAAIDPEGAYDTANITVNLNDLFENTAPTLDSSGDMALTTITEDQTTNSGNTVAQIIASAGGDRIADPDAGAVEGIAVTGLNSGNGTWQYSINGGGTWLDVDAISDSSALLLRATDKLRFVPDALNADSASVDFRAWDQTEGSAGSKVDASSNGGATAFSSATETASIAVTAVNDAPGMPGVSLGSVNEDGSKTWLVTDFVSGSWDVDDGALKGLAIVGADNSNGTWQYTLDGTNWFDVGSVATDNALLLAADATSSFRFTPDSDWNGTTGMLQYKAWDQTSGTAGTYVDASVSGGTTAFSGTSGSVLTVNAVNDAPVVNLDPNNTSGGADDGDYNATFTEGDAPVAIAAADAILSDVDDTSITALNININSMVPDGAAERVTIGGHQFTYGNAEYVVVAVGGTSFAIDYDGAESFGVTKDGVGEMPIADAEALLLSLTYENVSQDPTAGERVFDIVISDGALGASATSTISVVPVNDAPVITSDGGAATAGLTVAENQTTVTTVTASDVDVGDTPTFSITGGADAAKFSIDPNTGALTFDNAPDYENPGDVGADNVYEVEVTADDGNGGTDVQTISITVANTSDNMPVANADAYSVDEDGSLTVDWWDTDWSHRRELTFDNLAQSETLTDFPVLVVLNSGNIDYALTKDDGSDLRFFAADGTPLAYQIEQWNEAGDSSVWVRVPQITGGSSNDSITMYYGNAAANPVSDVAGVWDSDFVGVWHLNEEQAGAGNSGTYKDATGQGHDGIDRVAATGQEGQVTDGQQFGANDWIEIDHDPSLDLKDSMTISFWIKPTSDSGTFNRVVEKGLWGFNDSYYFGGGNGTNDLTFYLNGQGVIDTPDDVLTVGVWQHAAVSYTSNGDGTGTARLYLDGVEIATGNYTNGAVAGNTGRLAIGHPDASYDFDGFIDEVQISKTDRSADWIAAQYQATKNAFGSEFVQFGAAEVAPAIDGVITNDTDADGDLLDCLARLRAQQCRLLYLQQGRHIQLHSERRFRGYRYVYLQGQ